MTHKAEIKRKPPESKLSLAVYLVDQWHAFWNNRYCSRCFSVHAVRAPTKGHLEKKPVIFEIAILACWQRVGGDSSITLESCDSFLARSLRAGNVNYNTFKLNKYLRLWLAMIVTYCKRDWFACRFDQIQWSELLFWKKINCIEWRQKSTLMLFSGWWNRAGKWTHLRTRLQNRVFSTSRWLVTVMTVQLLC